jgi:hypothetical protein
MLGVRLLSIMGNFSNVNEFMDEIQVSKLVALHKPKQPH